MTTYKEAGVDIDLANKSIEKIKKAVKSTFNKNTLSDLGAFGGCYNFQKNDYDDPVLVSSTDGVGTKLNIAFLTEKHTTIGQCIVNHCVNDILVLGAKPLFFLDYFATGKLIPSVFEDVITGMTIACKQNSCSLIAGETAEMPGFYNDNEYDLSGTIVGAVDKKNLMSSRSAEKGDFLIALPSTGLHTNGYSLARKVLLPHFNVNDYIEELSSTLGESLLAIHKSYLKIIEPLLLDTSLVAMSHVTGGGLVENTERVIKKELKIKIDWEAWETPYIFNLIQDKGNVPIEDMRRSFNLGLGMVLVVRKDSLANFESYLKENSQKYFLIGEIV